MRQVAPASRGFTFIEIMVVMVIMSVMTAFAIPNLRSSLFTDQLKSTARRMIGIISEASQEAIRKQAAYSLSFDMEENRIWMSTKTAESDGFDSEKKNTISIPESVEIVDISSVSGGKRSQGTTEIRFSNKGYVDKTLIHLRSDDGRDMTIMLSPFLAVTRIYDSYIDLDDEKVNFK